MKLTLTSPNNVRNCQACNAKNQAGTIDTDTDAARVTGWAPTRHTTVTGRTRGLAQYAPGALLERSKCTRDTLGRRLELRA